MAQGFGRAERSFPKANFRIVGMVLKTKRAESGRGETLAPRPEPIRFD